MIKRICFFTVGFAFNRLVRMRYYEKIFPKEVEIFLFTTNKYDSIKKTKEQWDLNRTKVFVDNYSAIKTPFILRKFCIRNKIQRLVNLGTPGAGIPFILATFLSSRDYLMGFYGEVVKHNRERKYIKKIQKFFLLFQYWLVARFAKKLVFTDKTSFEKAPLFFLSPKEKMHFAEAPVNTGLFFPKNKFSIRKKLKLPKNKKIIIRVGRINHAKCGDIFAKLIEKNPEIFFILVGDWFEKEVPKIKVKNLLHLDKKSSKELVDYYNASDLSFGLHRAGKGMGIVAEEALACGIPIILPNTLVLPESSSIIKTKLSLEDANKKTQEFFSLSKKEKQKISKQAREYSLKYLSDDVWKKEFVKFHLD